MLITIFDKTLRHWFEYYAVYLAPTFVTKIWLRINFAFKVILQVCEERSLDDGNVRFD